MTRKELQALADTLAPGIRGAFLNTVERLSDQAAIASLIAAVEAGDMDSVMASLGIFPREYAEFVESVRTVYLQSGRATTEAFAFGFAITNPRAEAWLRIHSSTLVRQITEEQREAVRAILDAGMAAGHNPRRTALDLVGRIGQSGRRIGGVIGLTGQQAGWIANLRAELSDPDRMPAYFERKLRDRRFDSLVAKAIREGRALSVADINRLAARYADRVLKFRGDMIARTESLTAFGAARHEAYVQMIETDRIPAATKTWDATGDARTRPDHRAMDGQVRAHDEPFTAPDGSLLMHPGDTSLGASSRQTIMCRCWVDYRTKFP